MPVPADAVAQEESSNCLLLVISDPLAVLDRGSCQAAAEVCCCYRQAAAPSFSVSCCLVLEILDTQAGLAEVPTLLLIPVEAAGRVL